MCIGLWLMGVLSGGEVACSPEEKTIVLQVGSGVKVYVNICWLPMLDTQKHAAGTVYVFYDITLRYQKARHVQRVHQAVLALKEAISYIPEHLDLASPEAPYLLSPPELFVARQLVNVIGEVLDCTSVSLLAFRPPAGHVHYVMGSGFTSEQEQYRREQSGCFLLSEFVDETVLARLSANQAAVFPSDFLRLPPWIRADIGAVNLLSISLLLEKRLAGALVIGKAAFDS